MTRRMTNATRAELANAIRGRYRAAAGKAKRRIAEEFIAATGYHEKSAIRVLNSLPVAKVRQTRRRPLLYDEAARAAIIVLWEASTGIPWNDASGARLRAWMGVDSEAFYDASRVAMIPMGFCYPGRGIGGDLPPRRECAPLWMELPLSRLTHIELTLLVGRYAQRHFLGAGGKSSLTETVRAWREYAPKYFPLPHPSPRNQPWFRRNPWFERHLMLELRGAIRRQQITTRPASVHICTLPALMAKKHSLDPL